MMKSLKVLVLAPMSICRAKAETFAIKEGQIIDTEMIRFEKRINNI